jgi:glycosyltransferase involved in cell wall biosynthesis
MKVSVLVPTYNRPELLRETLHSLSRQTTRTSRSGCRAT